MNDKDSQKDNGFEEEDFVFEDDAEVVSENTTKEKLKKLREDLKSISIEKQKLLEDLQRAKADFVNMRKRDAADLEKAVHLANETLILDIIPVLDSFDLALADPAFSNAPPELKEGLVRISEQLISVLRKNGVEIIDPTGMIFDPQVHTAVQVTETDKEEEDHLVHKVMQKGYSLNKRIVRSPKVIIKEYKK